MEQDVSTVFINIWLVCSSLQALEDGGANEGQIAWVRRICLRTCKNVVETIDVKET
jgi:hypothetical protein